MSHPKLEYLKRFVKQNDPKEEYKVLACIGSGTYGDVFKAVNRETRELVAVKIMKIDLKDDIRSICQEIHTLRECQHPNIVQFYGSYLRNHKLWICMEYCGGQSMQDIYLHTRRPLEEECIAFVSRETLKGLNFMHERGRIHRDIKGANILLTDDGRVKVADFGVAAQLNNTIAKRTTLIGTPYWMAPEVASIDSRGAGYDGKCDVWGVGITAIEYAELQPPMFDLDPRKALQILGKQNYQPPRLHERNKWSQKFHSFIKCCLVKHERRRPDAATMLSHTFVINPTLSTHLTQRLLGFKRQIDLPIPKEDVPAQMPEPDLKPSFQNGISPSPVKPPASNQVNSTAAVISAVPVTISGPINARQPNEQGIPTRHPLLTNGSGLLANMQFQNSPSVSECLLESAGSTNALPHMVCTDGRTEEFAKNIDNINSVAQQLPIRIVYSNTTDDETFPTSSANSTLSMTITDSLKPERPPLPTWLMDNHVDSKPPVPVPNASVQIAGDEVPKSKPCPSSENLLFANGRVYNSSEDLLNEVMDEFEKRCSTFSPYTSPGEELNQQIEQSHSKGIPIDQKPEIKVNVLIDSRRRLQPAQIVDSTVPLLRSRSKRKAPPPPFENPTPIPDRSSTDSSAELLSNLPTSPLRSSSAEYMDESTSSLVRLEENIFSPVTHRLSQAPPRPPSPRVRHIDKDAEDKRMARQQHLEMGIGLPPTPKVLMGACFSLIFEGCPLKVNATATWINPDTRCQVILLGTNDGIYCLNLSNLADGTLELLINRPCTWLAVLSNTLMSICGQKPQLFSHNLITLMKSKGHSQPKLLPKRFQPTIKIPSTRGCHFANIIRNPYNGMKYLCGAINKTVIVMEWYNPRGTFIELKRVDVPKMPTPLLNFDLIIYQDQPIPFVCFGVYSTPDALRYRLDLVNLNEDCVDSRLMQDMDPEKQLQVVKVIQLEYNTLLICFPTHAVITNLSGRVKTDRHGWQSHLQFDCTVHSIVSLQDSVLAFHTHGLRGVGFDGQLTQDINDEKRVYRLLGCDKNVVVESRPSDDPMANSNIYLLAGHKDMC